MLTVAVLGPVELRRDGARLPLPSGKIMDLLVRLALDAGNLVRAERLIEDLWSDQAVTTARNTLQSKVSGLRRALGDPARLAGTRAGYTLLIGPADVDALEALRLADQVTALRDAGDVRGVISTTGTALALYRGEIFGGTEGEWLEPHRTRLEEARLRLTEDHLAARLELGAAGELVGELEELVVVHPLREVLWKLLITALYQAGRQADALAAFQRVRQHLADELGLDPGPQLQALERQILQHDPGLVPHAPRVTGNLPGLTASLVGREHDLAAVGELISQHRLVTITGAAGVGKTRLAIAAAQSAAWVGGAWLARLETANSIGSIWQAIGEAFDLGETSETAVLARLSAAPMLLVLDNCEQVVDQVCVIALQMLSATTGLTILATSQVPLRVDGEQVAALRPLAISDAVALFTQRAVRVPGGDQLVETVCRSLDGLPLAIELAAARTKVLSVQEIARRLSDRFALLGDPGGRRPARQRTLAAAIGWSYDLLFPDDQRGLWALACFAGGAPLAAAEHVLEALGVPRASAVDVADRLAGRSLLTTEIGDDGSVRYRLLDSVREFSVRKLQDENMQDVALRAHATWFTAAAARAQAGARGPQQSEHLALARSERANIDAALAWTAQHDPLLGVRLATGFGWTWAILGAGPQGARRIRAALAAAGDVAPEIHSDGLFLASWLEAAGGDVRQAAADLDGAQALADDSQQVTGQVYLAFLRTQEGRPAEVLSILDACRGDLAARGLDWELGAAWLLTAWAQIALGHVVEAQTACDQSLRIFIAREDDWARIHTGAMLGGLAQAQGRYGDAAQYLSQAAAAAGRLGFDAARALHLGNLGRAQQQGGDESAAAATLELAADAAIATGDLRMAALARVRLSRVQRALGRPEAARVSAERAQRWFRDAGGGEGALLADYVLAALAAEERESEASAAGAIESAGEHEAALLAVLERARANGDRETELLTSDVVARLHAQAGRPDEARALLQASGELLPAVRHLVTDSDRIDGRRAEELLTAPPDRR